jgi:hypothetical protein
VKHTAIEPLGLVIPSRKSFECDEITGAYDARRVAEASRWRISAPDAERP